MTGISQTIAHSLATGLPSGRCTEGMRMGHRRYVTLAFPRVAAKRLLLCVSAGTLQVLPWMMRLRMFEVLAHTLLSR